MGYELGTARRISGVVIGVVSDNVHPDGQYAVKLDLPWITSSDAGDDANFPSTWCPVSTPMAGGGRGFYALPEIGDEVVVSFIHGDMRFPIVIGALWNNESKAPVNGEGPKEITDPLGNPLGITDTCKDNKAASGENNGRYWVGRAGSGILINDTAGNEKLTMWTAKGSHFTLNDEKETITMSDAGKETYLALDAKNKKIILECTNGDIDVLCKKGKFNLEAKEIVTKAEKTQTHESGTDWKQEAGGKMNLKSGGNMTAEAPKIELNP